MDSLLTDITTEDSNNIFIIESRSKDQLKLFYNQKAVDFTISINRYFETMSNRLVAKITDECKDIIIPIYVGDTINFFLDLVQSGNNEAFNIVIIDGLNKIKELPGLTINLGKIIFNYVKDNINTQLKGENSLINSLTYPNIAAQINIRRKEMRGYNDLFQTYLSRLTTGNDNDKNITASVYTLCTLLFWLFVKLDYDTGMYIYNIQINSIIPVKNDGFPLCICYLNLIIDIINSVENVYPTTTQNIVTILYKVEIKYQISTCFQYFMSDTFNNCVIKILDFYFTGKTVQFINSMEMPFDYYVFDSIQKGFANVIKTYLNVPSERKLMIATKLLVTIENTNIEYTKFLTLLSKGVCDIDFVNNKITKLHNRSLYSDKLHNFIRVIFNYKTRLNTLEDDIKKYIYESDKIEANLLADKLLKEEEAESMAAKDKIDEKKAVKMAKAQEERERATKAKAEKEKQLIENRAMLSEERLRRTFLAKEKTKEKGEVEAMAAEEQLQRDYEENMKRRVAKAEKDRLKKALKKKAMRDAEVKSIVDSTIKNAYEISRQRIITGFLQNFKDKLDSTRILTDFKNEYYTSLFGNFFGEGDIWSTVEGIFAGDRPQPTKRYLFLAFLPSLLLSFGYMTYYSQDSVFNLILHGGFNLKYFIKNYTTYDIDFTVESKYPSEITQGTIISACKIICNYLNANKDAILKCFQTLLQYFNDMVQTGDYTPQTKNTFRNIFNFKETINPASINFIVQEVKFDNGLSVIKIFCDPPAVYSTSEYRFSIVEIAVNYNIPSTVQLQDAISNVPTRINTTPFEISMKPLIDFWSLYLHSEEYIIRELALMYANPDMLISINSPSQIINYTDEYPSGIASTYTSAKYTSQEQVNYRVSKIKVKAPVIPKLKAIIDTPEELERYKIV